MGCMVWIAFLMKKLKRKNIEWLIMADEDVLFREDSILLHLTLL